ncbi:hypothetical protein FACUT_11426 [Fusarium acutatum]|uniref:SET domain-containing protein n=1 Tax=Fusarium acutatum TaxID=78861 RepID=A0A8H4NAM8_9HYPO|nr:hypothetical protein FACUT_11426 [Fusarium acutatum]
MRLYNSTACFDKIKRDQAFKDPSGTSALIYSLASSIHHACPDCAQATFLVAKAYDITVTLVKDVRAGEEIFIDFGEARSHFVCYLCNTGGWKRRKRQNMDETRRDEETLTEMNHKTRKWAVVLKGFLAKLDPRNMFKTAESPSE